MHHFFCEAPEFQFYSDVNRNSKGVYLKLGLVQGLVPNHVDALTGALTIILTPSTAVYAGKNHYLNVFELSYSISTHKDLDKSNPRQSSFRQRGGAKYPPSFH